MVGSRSGGGGRQQEWGMGGEEGERRGEEGERRGEEGERRGEGRIMYARDFKYLCKTHRECAAATTVCYSHCESALERYRPCFLTPTAVC